MRPKERPKTALYAIGLFVVYAILMFFTVEYSAYKTFYSDAGMSKVFSKMMQGMVENEFKLPCMPEDYFGLMATVTVFFVLAAWWMIVENKIYTFDMPGKEFGTASWLVDVDAYSLRFADCKALYMEPGMKESTHMKMLLLEKKIYKAIFRKELKIKIK